MANGLVTRVSQQQETQRERSLECHVRASQRIRLKAAAGASNSVILEHISAAEYYGGKQAENRGIPGYSVKIFHLAVRTSGRRSGRWQRP